jgi:hypothetical protein
MAVRATHGRSGRRRLVVAVVAAASAVGMGLIGPGVGYPSSHREAPLIAAEPQLDNTDVYAFVSPDRPDTVTVVANWIPFEEPNGGPNFYSFAQHSAYDINIDSDGDARADVTYRWIFTTRYKNPNTFLYNTGVVDSLDDPDLNVTQTYTLMEMRGRHCVTLVRDGRVAPSFTGRASMPNYAALADAAVTPFAGGGLSFAGQADDPFFADLRVFDLLYGGDLSEVGQDSLRGYNVNTIVLQVPKTDLALRGDPARNPVIGVWSSTSRPRVDVMSAAGGMSMADRISMAGGVSAAGGMSMAGGRSGHGGLVQVSRLGMPLFNEVIVPLGAKDRFNATKPSGDAVFTRYVTEPELPRLIQSIYGVPEPDLAPNDPNRVDRTDLAEVFLTGLCAACGPVPVDLNSQRLNADADSRRFRPSEQLRLNMSVATPQPGDTVSRLGALGGDLKGFPDGRRLADDVVDIEVRVAEGALLPNPNPVATGFSDGVDTNNAVFRTTFPYVALPNMDGVNTAGAS